MSKQSAKIIKSIIADQKLSITQFAKDMGLSRVSIHKFLKGENLHPKSARIMRQRLFDLYNLAIPFEKLFD